MNHCNDSGKTLFTIISQIDLTYYIHTCVNDVTFFKKCITLIRLNEFNLVLKIHSFIHINYKSITMKGNEKLLTVLKSLLADELTVINQYMVQSEMRANWGYGKLHMATQN